MIHTILVSSLSLVLSGYVTIVWATPPKQDLATKIADHYLKSFSKEAIQKTQKVTPAEKKQLADPLKLSEAISRAIVLNEIFASSSVYNLLQQRTPILNRYAWNDLNLFYGTTSSPGYHLLSRINRTITMLGEGALATMLVTPTNNREELCQRQCILKTLYDHPTVLQRLKESLRGYKTAEQRMLSFWSDTDPSYTKAYQDYMHRKFYLKNKRRNTAHKALEASKRFRRDFIDIQAQFLFYPVAGIVPFEILNVTMLAIGTSLDKQRNVRHLFYNAVCPRLIPLYSIYSILKESSQSFLGWTWVISMNLHTAWLYYNGIKNYKEYASVLRHLALRMADLQAFIKATTEINDLVAATPALEKVYGVHLVSIRKLLSHASEDTEIGRLIHNLQHLPLTSWSYFLHNAGKLLASLKLFVAHKNRFVNAMYELGQLDAFVGITTLMQEAQAYHAEQAYVFTTFLDRSQKPKPYLKLTGMWHPFLDAKVAIANDLEMDATPGHTRNIILTGPNAGGKSTFLTGVTTSLLLSQTFGIAPAKEAVITPFNSINTYMSVLEGIAEGKSFFMAGVDRAQQHLHILESLQEDEFSFTIFDEPFSGTNPTEGAAAEYSILAYIANYTNTLNIVATHYPTVMLLEKRSPTKGFANYKVFIHYHGSGKKIAYTYKIIPGASNQAIAIDILAEQGYDTKMLEQARDIIAHPEKYLKTFE